MLTALLGWFDEVGVQRVDLRATPAGRPLYEDLGFRELRGATMSRAAVAGAGPGLGWAGR